MTTKSLLAFDAKRIRRKKLTNVIDLVIQLHKRRSPELETKDEPKCMMPQRASTDIRPKFSAPDLTVTPPQALLPEWIFRRMLCVERKRAERSARRLVLMLLEGEYRLHPSLTHGTIQSLESCLRDTDVVGWYSENEAIGVLFTEIAAGETPVVEILSRKARRALSEGLSGQQASSVTISFYVFPDDFHSQAPSRRALTAMFPDFAGTINTRRSSLAAKRCVDIIGSVFLLLLLSPCLLLIACMVKVTSKGSVLFRQTRLGQFGEGFTFLKFRSMHAETNHEIHQEYIKRFINDQTDSDERHSTRAVYKLEGDPRITKIGAFLRRTSLDELPQLLNVLTGKMSLVGPRPPLPYEFSSYQTWHRRRLFMKPGITGSWQVDGRSRVKFDEMVRMDLRYVDKWSLWLDMKILLRTPRAVLSGNGAY